MDVVILVINALNLLEHVQDGRANLLRISLVRVHLHNRLHLLLGEQAGQVVVHTPTLFLQLLLLLLLVGHVNGMLWWPEVDLWL